MFVLMAEAPAHGSKCGHPEISCARGRLLMHYQPWRHPQSDSITPNGRYTDNTERFREQLLADAFISVTQTGVAELAGRQRVQEQEVARSDVGIGVARNSLMDLESLSSQSGSSLRFGQAWLGSDEQAKISG